MHYIFKLIKSLVICISSKYSSTFHHACYISYACLGSIGVLESRSKLPKNTFRKFTVLFMLLMGISFNAHGHSKSNRNLGYTHILLSYLFFAISFLMAFSLHDESIYEASVGSYVVMVIMGLWFMIIGAYEEYFINEGITMNEISAVFILEVSFMITLSYVILTVIGTHESGICSTNTAISEENNDISSNQKKDEQQCSLV